MKTLAVCVLILVIAGCAGAVSPGSRAALGTLAGLGIVVTFVIGLCVNSVKEWTR